MTHGNLWTDELCERLGGREWHFIHGSHQDPTLSSAYKQRKKDTKREAKTSQFDALKADAIALAEMITRFPLEGKRTTRQVCY